MKMIRWTYISMTPRHHPCAGCDEQENAGDRLPQMHLPARQRLARAERCADWIDLSIRGAQRFQRLFQLALARAQALLFLHGCSSFCRIRSSAPAYRPCTVET